MKEATERKEIVALEKTLSVESARSVWVTDVKPRVVKVLPDMTVRKTWRWPPIWISFRIETEKTRLGKKAEYVELPKLASASHNKIVPLIRAQPNAGRPHAKRSNYLIETLFSKNLRHCSPEDRMRARMKGGSPTGGQKEIDTSRKLPNFPPT